MQRIVQGRSATLTKALYSDGTATNPSPDSATVTITRDDGTAVVTAAVATDTGTGTFSYTLTPAQTATLDRLTVTWTATYGGQAQTFSDKVEVVGDTLFTLAEAKAIKLGGAKTIGTTFSTDEIIKKRTVVEVAIESRLGFALVPRYERERTSGRGTVDVRLKWPYLRGVRSVVVASTALTPTELAALTYDDYGFVSSSAAWTVGRSNVTVAYEHGLDVGNDLAEEAREQALLLTKVWLVSGPVDDRVTTMASPDTGITAVLATPGRGGSIFGVPSVDEFVLGNRRVSMA